MNTFLIIVSILCATFFCSAMICMIVESVMRMKMKIFDVWMAVSFGGLGICGCLAIFAYGIFALLSTPIDLSCIPHE